jgi:hypothetical protein
MRCDHGGGSTTLWWRAYRNHQMRVGSVGPHHVRLRWIGIGGRWITHCFGRGTDNHDVGPGCYPMITIGPRSRVWIGIACAVVTGQHIDKADAVGWSRMRHPRVRPLHSVVVQAHGIAGGDHAGEAV